MSEIKRLRYRGFGRAVGEVLYVIIADRCTFTGVTKTTSTINVAEHIVEAIARAECMTVEDLKFFDLQTHLGYCKKPGEFEYDHLKFDQGICNPSWEPVECPPEIRQLFADQIE
ncbi:MAG: hypothetical protein ABIH87_01110 [bacterium]